MPFCRGRDRSCSYFFFQAEDGIRDVAVTEVQTCALPIYTARAPFRVHCRNDQVAIGRKDVRKPLLVGRPGRCIEEPLFVILYTSSCRSPRMPSDSMSAMSTWPVTSRNSSPMSPPGKGVVVRWRKQAGHPSVHGAEGREVRTVFRVGEIVLGDHERFRRRLRIEADERGIVQGIHEEIGWNKRCCSALALLHTWSSPCSPFSWRCSGKPPSGKRPRV